MATAKEKLKKLEALIDDRIKKSKGTKDDDAPDDDDDDDEPPKGKKKGFWADLFGDDE